MLQRSKVHMKHLQQQRAGAGACTQHTCTCTHTHTHTYIYTHTHTHIHTHTHTQHTHTHTHTCTHTHIHSSRALNQITAKPSQRFVTLTVECPREGDVRKYVRFSRGARGEKPEKDRPPFWFYGESIRTSVHGNGGN